METTSEEEAIIDGVVNITDATRAFLEAAFSGTMDNNDLTAHIRRIGIPNCDQIHCPKLNGVLKAVLLSDAIKADGYLSWLQQFCLDAVSPLTTILECTEAGDLTPEKVVSSVQVALCLMGSTHQYMAQEIAVETESLLKIHG